MPALYADCASQRKRPSNSAVNWISVPPVNIATANTDHGIYPIAGGFIPSASFGYFSG
jgi:hypothetical protein